MPRGSASYACIYVGIKLRRIRVLCGVGVWKHGFLQRRISEQGRRPVFNVDDTGPLQPQRFYFTLDGTRGRSLFKSVHYYLTVNS
jgi:hypothetical protein